jgi:hypothetical protein
MMTIVKSLDRRKQHCCVGAFRTGSLGATFIVVARQRARYQWKFQKELQILLHKVSTHGAFGE